MEGGSSRQKIEIESSCLISSDLTGGDMCWEWSRHAFMLSQAPHIRIHRFPTSTTRGRQFVCSKVAFPQGIKHSVVRNDICPLHSQVSCDQMLNNVRNWFHGPATGSSTAWFKGKI